MQKLLATLSGSLEILSCEILLQNRVYRYPPKDTEGYNTSKRRLDVTIKHN